MTTNGHDLGRNRRVRVIVVGAGSAGAVIAARLSQDPDLDVLLLESGPNILASNEVGAVASTNFVDALDVADRNLRIPVRRTQSQGLSEYVRGTGVGGSSSINAMVGMWGMASDYDRWSRDLGCDDWSWRDVAPVFANLPLPLHTTLQRDWGKVDSALVESGVRLGFDRRDDLSTASLAARGVGSVSLTCNGGRRASVNDVYLEPARGRSNFEIRGGSTVERLNMRGLDVVGVHLENGDDIDADAVVVCAGAIATPQILLRSNVQRSGIGRGVKDHPAVSFTLSLKEPGTPKYGVSTLLRATSTLNAEDHKGDIHILPLNQTESSDRMHGAMFAAVMQVRSTGTIRLVDSTADGTGKASDAEINLNLLGDERDMQAMVEATSLLRKLLESKSFENIADSLMCDDQGTLVSSLNDLTQAQFILWIQNNVGSYSHIGCSNKMGAISDDDAVVDTNGRLIGYHNVWVCDASIFPDLPTGNTHLPVVMMAERISQRIGEALKTN
jgi:choline dehydrogenase/5-(hydroxymethyl)furfural/furfural oxidase